VTQLMKERELLIRSVVSLMMAAVWFYLELFGVYSAPTVRENSVAWGGVLEVVVIRA
jgi:hypothetical protein